MRTDGRTDRQTDIKTVMPFFKTALLMRLTKARNREDQ